MLGDPCRHGPAADEQPGLDVPADAGLGEVGTAHQEHAVICDGEFGVHLGDVHFQQQPPVPTAMWRLNPEPGLCRVVTGPFRAVLPTGPPGL